MRSAVPHNQFHSAEDIECELLYSQSVGRQIVVVARHPAPLYHSP
jgi:hypothetical protein